jgi:hypothetical protein
MGELLFAPAANWRVGGGERLVAYLERRTPWDS